MIIFQTKNLSIACMFFSLQVYLSVLAMNTVITFLYHAFRHWDPGSLLISPPPLLHWTHVPLHHHLLLPLPLPTTLILPPSLLLRPLLPLPPLPLPPLRTFPRSCPLLIYILLQIWTVKNFHQFLKIWIAIHRYSYVDS